MSFDLTAKYGGLTLKSPVIVGACPLTAEELIRISLVNSGVGAIVLPSLFEEQLIQWKDCEQTNWPTAKLDFKFDQWKGNLHHNTVCHDPESYLRLVEQATARMSIPVIASLNGRCANNWSDFAVKLQSAGADAIELYVRSPPPSDYSDPCEVENMIVETASLFAEKTTIPLFLKLGRHYTSFSHLSRRLQSTVHGLVLFGRSPVIDIELDSLQLTNSWGLTKPGSIVNSLEAIMRVRSYCPEMPLAANGGIASSSDLIKALLAGADVGMVTSAVYRNGPTVIGNQIEGLIRFMEQNQMQSLEDLAERRRSILDQCNDHLDYSIARSSYQESFQPHETSQISQCDRWGHPQPPR